MAIDTITPEMRQAELLDAQLRLYRAQAKWEPYKALAAIVATAAIFAGSVLGLSNWLAGRPQTINVHLDAPLVLPNGGR